MPLLWKEAKARMCRHDVLDSMVLPIGPPELTPHTTKTTLTRHYVLGRGTVHGPRMDAGGGCMTLYHLVLAREVGDERCKW